MRGALGSPPRSASQGEAVDTDPAGGLGKKDAGRGHEHPTGKALGILRNAQGIRPVTKVLTVVIAVCPHTTIPFPAP